MIRVIMRNGQRVTIEGATIRCDVGPSGALAIQSMTQISKMTPQGMMQVYEATPIKIYAADQWKEVEWIEEPGDGLTVLPPGVESAS